MAVAYKRRTYVACPQLASAVPNAEWDDRRMWVARKVLLKVKDATVNYALGRTGGLFVAPKDGSGERLHFLPTGEPVWEGISPVSCGKYSAHVSLYFMLLRAARNLRIAAPREGWEITEAEIDQATEDAAHLLRQLHSGQSLEAISEGGRVTNRQLSENISYLLNNLKAGRREVDENETEEA